MVPGPTGHGTVTGVLSSRTTELFVMFAVLANVTGTFQARGAAAGSLTVKRDCSSRTACEAPSPTLDTITTGKPGRSVQPAARSTIGLPDAAPRAAQRSAVVVLENLWSAM